MKRALLALALLLSAVPAHAVDPFAYQATKKTRQANRQNNHVHADTFPLACLERSDASTTPSCPTVIASYNPNHGSWP